MFLSGPWVDPLYIVLFVVTLAISGAAPLFIRWQFGKNDAVRNGAGLPGGQIGGRIARYFSVTRR